MGEGTRAIWAIAAPDMDLLAGEGQVQHSIQHSMMCAHFGQAFVTAHNGPYIQEAKTPRVAWSALDAHGVRNATAQHLISAADPQNAPTAPVKCAQVDVPTLSAQKGQITACRL